MSAMRVFALSDTHLSFGMPGKAMDKFGPPWVDHAGRIERNWRAVVGDDDLVLVPGDISWAMRLDGPHGASPDLEFLGRLADEGRLRPVIDRVLPFDQVKESHDLSETGRARGKIVLRWA